MTLTAYETTIDITETENEMFCALVNEYVERYHDDDAFDVENYEMELENMSHQDFTAEYIRVFMY